MPYYLPVDFGKRGVQVVQFEMSTWPSFCGGRILTNFAASNLKDWKDSTYARLSFPKETPLTPEQLRNYIIDNLGVTGSLIMADRRGHAGDEWIFPLFEKDFNSWQHAVSCTDSGYYINRVHHSNVRHISCITKRLATPDTTVPPLPAKKAVVAAAAPPPAPPPAPVRIPETGIRWPAPPGGRPEPKSKKRVARRPAAVVVVEEVVRLGEARIAPFDRLDF
jgi:hypothetical protein